MRGLCKLVGCIWCGHVAGSGAITLSYTRIYLSLISYLYVDSFFIKHVASVDARPSKKELHIVELYIVRLLSHRLITISNLFS